MKRGYIRTAGERWQLCPKCNGDGHLGRYNSPVYVSTTVTPICDVCNGAKILASPNSGREELEKEVERLKGLIDEAYKTGWFDSPEDDDDVKTVELGLEDFKTENNL